MLMAAEVELLVATPPGPEPDAMAELTSRTGFVARKRSNSDAKDLLQKPFPYDYMQIFKASSTMCYEI